MEENGRSIMKETMTFKELAEGPIVSMVVHNDIHYIATEKSIYAIQVSELVELEFDV